MTQEDDGKPYPAGSFDYSSIAAHPRLLFTLEDEKLLKKNLRTNSDLALVHEQILRVCDKYLNEDTSIRKLKGIRLLAVSREVMQRIFYLSYAYRMTGESKYLDRAEMEINAVCDFVDWNPSHFLDVAEMATGIAIGYDWLFGELKAETREKVRQSLLSKAFEPSKNDKYNYFLRMSNNWNPVCNAGLTMAALAIFESAKDAAAEMIERAVDTNKKVLATYAPDGNYDEGYSYWEYGTNYQVLLLAALESALGSDNGLHNAPGFMKTAGYMLYMSGTNGLCFNYSDCDRDEVPLVGMFWFAKKTGDSSLLYSEKKKIEKGFYADQAGKNRFLPLLMIFGNMADFTDIPIPKKKLWIGQGRAPVALVRTGWCTVKDTYLGIKAGRASVPHGHMDAGSFVYDKDGIRWAMDLGAENYHLLESNKVKLWNYAQNSTRWNVFRYNNKSHNTLTINDQLHVADGFAKITDTYDTDEKRGATIEMTPLFNDLISGAQRTIVLINGELEIADTIRTNASRVTLRWNMLTPAVASLSEENKTITLHKDGKTMQLKVESASPVTLKIVPAVPATAYESSNENTVMVGFEALLPPNATHGFNVKFESGE